MSLVWYGFKSQMKRISNALLSVAENINTELYIMLCNTGLLEISDPGGGGGRFGAHDFLRSKLLSNTWYRN